MSQFNQPIYVSSSSNQSLNQQQLTASNLYLNGPIYVSSNVATTQGIPNSASNNSVYASQQAVIPNAPPAPPAAPIYSQTNGTTNPSNGYAATGPPQPPAQFGGPQTSQIPVAPPPPPAFNTAFPNNANNNNNNNTSHQTQAAPPAPAMPMPTNAPPPPPLPPGGLMNTGTMDMSSLAAQLQQAKLKRNAKTNANPPAENSGSSTSSGGSGNYGTIGRSSTGMASMMDEMAKTLARRRAQAEKKPDVSFSYFF